MLRINLKKKYVWEKLNIYFFVKSETQSNAPVLSEKNQSPEKKKQIFYALLKKSVGVSWKKKKKTNHV